MYLHKNTEQAHNEITWTNSSICASHLYHYTIILYNSIELFCLLIAYYLYSYIAQLYK